MKAMLAVGMFAFLGAQDVSAQDLNVTGNYSATNGAVLTVERTTENDQYRITAKDPGEYFWEGIGYYSNDCMCIKSVFRYTSHKDTYGDMIGYHKFEIKANGDTLVKRGGWDNTNEFGSDTFTRNNK